MGGGSRLGGVPIERGTSLVGEKWSDALADGSSIEKESIYPKRKNAREKC